MGSLGPAVARSVATQMRFAFVDEEIIAVAAEQERLDPEVVADAEERRSFLSRVFEDWGSSGAMDQLGAVGVAMVSETGPNPPSATGLLSVRRSMTPPTAARS